MGKIDRVTKNKSQEQSRTGTSVKGREGLVNTSKSKKFLVCLTKNE